MIDIAWTEFIFVALLALILLGPKELPVVLRTLGRWIGKARAIVADIQNQLEDYTKEKPQDKPIDK